MMKKATIIFSLLIIICTSCGRKTKSTLVSDKKDTNQVVQPLIDSLLFEVDTFHVAKREPDCTNECITVDLAYEMIRNPLKPVHDSVNRYVDTLVRHSLNEISDPVWGLDLEKRAQEFMDFATTPESKEMGGVWDWSFNSTIYRPTAEIISVSSSWGGYTGGAHGNGVSYTANFYTSTGQQVTLKNLFTDVDKLNKIGIKYFKKDNGLDEKLDVSEQGWYFTDEDFQLNENFDINTGSITWQFNVYEIGDYLHGGPSVTIPISEISHLMRSKMTEVKIQ